MRNKRGGIAVGCWCLQRTEREEKGLLGPVVVGLQRRKEGRNRDGWFVLVIVVRKRKGENRVVNGRRKKTQASIRIQTHYQKQTR